MRGSVYFGRSEHPGMNTAQIHEGNFSHDRVELIANERYLVIDPLYLKAINSHRVLAIGGKWLELQQVAFPYGENSFALFSIKKTFFSAEMIRDSNAEEQDLEFMTLSVDSGAILFIGLDHLEAVLSRLEYDELFSDPISTVSSRHLLNVTRDIPKGAVALLLSPGTTSDVDFIGSGTYRLIDE